MNLVKLHTQKPVEFLYTIKEVEVSGRKFKKTIPFTIASKRTKYLGINLTNDVKDLHNENCKTLIKKLEKKQKNRKIFCDQALEDVHIVKMFFQPKQCTHSILSLTQLK